MIDELHIPVWNRTRKPLAIAFSGVGRGLKERDNGGNVTNVQYKSNRNCHYETPLVSWVYPNKDLFFKKISKNLKKKDMLLTLNFLLTETL
jgi:hypothetical protein